jgi:predicted small secreted protein
MKKLLTLGVLGVVFALAGCNTVKGIGQDIQRGGQVLEDAARK